MMEEPRSSPEDATHRPAGRGRWSLRGRLIWLTTATTLFAWLTGGGAALIAAYGEGKALQDEHLTEISRAVLTFAGHHMDHLRSEGVRTLVHWESESSLDPRYDYQIWSRKGELLLRSHKAPETPFAPFDARGLMDRTVHGNPHRVYVGMSTDGDWQVQVAEEMSARGLFLPSFNLALLTFFVASILLILLFNRWFLNVAFRGMAQSAAQLVDRSPNDLRRVECDDPPRELAPLLDSINALFARIERAMHSERSFTANAAHELRTPLAAIRMQAQVADRARSQREAHGSLQSLLVCVDRASRMIDQLLTLARVESAASQPATFGTVRLDRLVEQVARDLEPALKESNVELELRLQPAEVTGVEAGLVALVRNLVDNAIHHASAGQRVAVTTNAEGGAVVLNVDDAGPGIPAEERERVFERFYRMPETNADGCGVGLSIVRCVAELHHASIALDASSLGGLRVTVTFRAPESTTRGAGADGRPGRTTSRAPGGPSAPAP